MPTMTDKNFANLIYLLGDLMQENPHFVAGYVSGLLTEEQIKEVIRMTSRFGIKESA